MKKANTKANAGRSFEQLTCNKPEVRAPKGVREFLVKLKRYNVGGPERRLVRLAMLALCLSSSGMLARAAPKPPRVPTEHPAAPLPADRTSALPARGPDAARLRELAAQREFQYVEPDATTDAWDAFWARLWRWLDRLRSTPTGRFTWKYGMYAVALGLLVFAVLKLLQVDITGAFGRSARRAPLGYDTMSEDIHGVDFPARVAEAEAAGNFRLALRLGYLEVLKRLTDRGLIEWQPDKTNHAYLAELAPGSLREAFRAATREFEYVWYGELRLNSNLYHQARATQRAATTQLDGTRAGAAASNAVPA